MRFGIGGVLLAANGPSAERRVLDHADGRAPVGMPGSADRLRRLHADDFDAQVEPFLTAIAEYGGDRGDTLPAP